MLQELINQINELPLDEKVNRINEIKLALHEISPFNTEPVDCVLWVKNDSVHANDYNPNSVAPPEMELLRLSQISGLVEMFADKKFSEAWEVDSNYVYEEIEDIK